jgi:hypothetical protein
MNRNGLWIVVVVAAVWVSFLLGYAVSSHTVPGLEGGPKAAAGGYGKLPAKGAAKQQGQEAKKGPN